MNKATFAWLATVLSIPVPALAANGSGYNGPTLDGTVIPLELERRLNFEAVGEAYGYCFVSRTNFGHIPTLQRIREQFDPNPTAPWGFNYRIGLRRGGFGNALRNSWKGFLSEYFAITLPQNYNSVQLAIEGDFGPRPVANFERRNGRVYLQIAGGGRAGTVDGPAGPSGEGMIFHSTRRSLDGKWPVGLELDFTDPQGVRRELALEMGMPFVHFNRFRTGLKTCRDIDNRPTSVFTCGGHWVQGVSIVEPRYAEREAVPLVDRRTRQDSGLTFNSAELIECVRGRIQTEIDRFNRSYPEAR